MFKFNSWIAVLALALLMCACQQKDTKAEVKTVKLKPVQNPTVSKTTTNTSVDYDSLSWSEILNGDGLVLDLKYATTDNFTEQMIYPCERCFLRPELAAKIHEIKQDLFEQHKYGLKLFDCYRPRPAQQRLWDIYPDLNYVSPPTKGSMHNRGLAVDLTIIDEQGEALDMGTPFDFFGPESHSAYDQLSQPVLKNRKLLRAMMEKHGLAGIRTEWWHFSLRTASYELSDWEWACDK